MFPPLFVLLSLLAGVARAAHDAMSFSPGCLARFGPWWDNRTSSLNKYKSRDPAAGPAFWLSTTWLVGYTDAWHATNLLAWGFADATLLLLTWPAPTRWWAVGGIVARRLVFEPVYSRLRKLAQ